MVLKKRRHDGDLNEHDCMAETMNILRSGNTILMPFFIIHNRDNNIKGDKLVHGKRNNDRFHYKVRFILLPFLIELNNDFNHIDNSIRSLSRAISYSTMISAFGDEAV